MIKWRERKGQAEWRARVKGPPSRSAFVWLNVGTGWWSINLYRRGILVRSDGARALRAESLEAGKQLAEVFLEGGELDEV